MKTIFYVLYVRFLPIHSIYRVYHITLKSTFLIRQNWSMKKIGESMTTVLQISFILSSYKWEIPLFCQVLEVYTYIQKAFWRWQYMYIVCQMWQNFEIAISDTFKTSTWFQPIYRITDCLERSQCNTKYEDDRFDFVKDYNIDFAWNHWSPKLLDSKFRNENKMSKVSYGYL